MSSSIRYDGIGYFLSFVRQSFSFSLHFVHFAWNHCFISPRRSLLFGDLILLVLLQKTVEPEETKADADGHTTPHPSDVLDMPVDPNEPTYCLCHQVSYGEMIGCDNTDVSAHTFAALRTVTRIPFPFSAQSSGSTSLVLPSPRSPRGSGTVRSVHKIERRNSSAIRPSFCISFYYFIPSFYF